MVQKLSIPQKVFDLLNSKAFFQTQVDSASFDKTKTLDAYAYSSTHNTFNENNVQILGISNPSSVIRAIGQGARSIELDLFNYFNRVIVTKLSVNKEDVKRFFLAINKFAFQSSPYPFIIYFDGSLFTKQAYDYFNQALAELNANGVKVVQHSDLSSLTDLDSYLNSADKLIILSGAQSILSDQTPSAVTFFMDSNLYFYRRELIQDLLLKSFKSLKYKLLTSFKVNIYRI